MCDVYLRRQRRGCLNLNLNRSLDVGVDEWCGGTITAAATGGRRLGWQVVAGRFLPGEPLAGQQGSGPAVALSGAGHRCRRGVGSGHQDPSGSCS
jgi:hypothetical protein